jgi:hypothetical protein
MTSEKVCNGKSGYQISDPGHVIAPARLHSIAFCIFLCIGKIVSANSPSVPFSFLVRPQKDGLVRNVSRELPFIRSHGPTFPS